MKCEWCGQSDDNVCERCKSQIGATRNTVCIKWHGADPLVVGTTIDVEFRLCYKCGVLLRDAVNDALVAIEATTRESAGRSERNDRQ